MKENNQQQPPHDQIERKLLETLDVSEWDVMTDTGWQPITTVSKTIPYDVWRLETESGKSLECADDHIVFNENFEEIFVKNLITGISKIQTSGGTPETVIALQKLDLPPESMYDMEVDSNDHRFFANDILSHNSITTCAFLLWTILFQEEQNIAILANKQKTAQKLLNDLKKSYMNIPLWMQSGVAEWNKGNILLENGSQITASATSADAIRGSALNCIAGDTEISILDESIYRKITISTLKNELERTPHNNNNFDNKVDIPERLDNKYSRIYDLMIAKCKARGWTKKTAPCYTEKHHIMPRSFGGSNEEENLVVFTAREHFISHKLLVKMYSGKWKSKMVYAIHLMMTVDNEDGKHHLKITSHDYERIKAAYSEVLKSRVVSEHTRQLISKGLKEKKKTKEHQDKINKNPEKIAKTAAKHRGMKRSDETCLKMSAAGKGKIPWNKGKKVEDPEVRKRMSDAAQLAIKEGRRVSWNKGLATLSLTDKPCLRCGGPKTTNDTYCHSCRAKAAAERRNRKKNGIKTISA